MKKFKVKKGFVWIHVDLPMKYQKYIVEEKGSWKKIDIDHYEQILSKVFALRAGLGFASIQESFLANENLNPTYYKKFFKFFSTDDLEVFIPKKTIIY